MLTPEDIEKKQFGTRMRGYDVDEVDNYLDTVVNVYQASEEARLRLRNENENLRRKLAALSDAPTQVIPPVIGDAVRLLNIAQQTHDQTVTEANDQAGRIVSGAEKTAADIVAAGHEKRHAMIGQLEERRQGLQEHVAALQKTVEVIRVQMQQALEATGGNNGSTG